MRKAPVIFLILLTALLAACHCAAGEKYTGRVAYFQEKYVHEIESVYPKTYTAAMSDKQIQLTAQRLQELGYLPVREVTQEFSESLKKAVRIFQQQMRIGDGEEITPLMQAVLFSPDAEPVAFPLVRSGTYSKGGNQKSLLPYTYGDLADLRAGAPCSIGGTVEAVANTDARSVSITLRINASRPPVTVAYTYPEGTARFLPGDAVIVMGTLMAKEGDTYTFQGDLIGFKAFPAQ